MLSAQLTATIPTGSYSNGSTDASVSPALLGGKGFGHFDVISSLGGTLPTGDTKTLGRSIAWNTTAQYRLGKYVAESRAQSAARGIDVTLAAFEAHLHGEIWLGARAIRREAQQEGEATQNDLRVTTDH